MSDDPTFLEPANSVIQKLGGPDNAAKAAGITVRRVLRWCRPKTKGGTDGLVPTHRQQRMLDWARDNGKSLAPEDFFVGRETSNSHARSRGLQGVAA